LGRSGCLDTRDNRRPLSRGEIGTRVMTERVAGAAGIAAGVIFWTALFGFAAAYPGYSHSHKAISELGAFGAPHALAWNLIGFVTPGLLLAACGAGLARTIDVSGRKTLVYWLLVISGLGFVGTGLIPAEMRDGSPFMQSPFTIGHVVMTLLSWYSVDDRGISGRLADQAKSSVATRTKGQHHPGRRVCRGACLEHPCSGIADSHAPPRAGAAHLVRNLFRLVPHHGASPSCGGSANSASTRVAVTSEAQRRAPAARRRSRQSALRPRTETASRQTLRDPKA
jgi:hypothetical membrane protein